MRLLVWRLGRIGGGIGKLDDKKFGANENGMIIEDNEEIVTDILVTLQNRLESIRQCHEFLSHYTGEAEDIDHAFEEKIAESIAESTVESIAESIAESTVESIAESIAESTVELTVESTISTAEGNSNQAGNGDNEEAQNQSVVEPVEPVEPQNASGSSSVLSASSSSTSPPNKGRKSKMSFKEFVALQSSSGKEMSTAAYFIRWILPNGSHKSSNSHKDKLDKKKISPTTSTTVPPIPISTTNKSEMQPSIRRYAPHRHIYAEKAIAEYEAVNQEYAEWCAQIANIEKGNLVDSAGTNSANSMIRFPGLAVEYPKYFGNGFGNSPLM